MTVLCGQYSLHAVVLSVYSCSFIAIRGAFNIISGAFNIICGTYNIICGAFYIICGALNIICGAFYVICGAFNIICGAFNIICGAFNIICGAFLFFVFFEKSFNYDTKFVYFPTKTFSCCFLCCFWLKNVVSPSN